MTSRCYEELQAKLENQQLPPLLGRETTSCTRSENTIYYDKDIIPVEHQLSEINNWEKFNESLVSLVSSDSVSTPNNLITTALETAQNILDDNRIAASDAVSNAAEKLLAYHTVVALDTNTILTQNFFVPETYVHSSDAELARQEASIAASDVAAKTLEVENSFRIVERLTILSNNEIGKGETVSIFIENNILIGRIYRNIKGTFIKANFSQYYPFTIQQIKSYKTDEKNKTNKNNYLAGQRTKSQKWSKIAKNLYIRKSKILTNADKCSYAINN